MTASIMSPLPVWLKMELFAENKGPYMLWVLFSRHCWSVHTATNQIIFAIVMNRTILDSCLSYYLRPSSDQESWLEWA